MIVIRTTLICKRLLIFVIKICQVANGSFESLSKFYQSIEGRFGKSDFNFSHKIKRDIHFIGQLLLCKAKSFAPVSNISTQFLIEFGFHTYSLYVNTLQIYVQTIRRFLTLNHK